MGPRGGGGGRGGRGGASAGRGRRQERGRWIVTAPKHRQQESGAAGGTERRKVTGKRRRADDSAESSEDDGQPPPSIGGYDALLRSLAEGGGAASVVLARRRRQQEGDSSDSDGEEDERELAVPASAEVGERQREQGNAAAAVAVEEEQGAAEELLDGETGAAGAGDAPSDTFDGRFERSLAAAEAESLSGGAGPTWADAGALPGWQRARWEAGGGTLAAQQQQAQQAQLLQGRAGPRAHGLPGKLLGRWAAVQEDERRRRLAVAGRGASAAAAAGSEQFASRAQASFFAALRSGRDVAFSGRGAPPPPPPEGGAAPADDLMDACCLHVCAHVLRTRHTALSAAEKLRKARGAAGARPQDGGGPEEAAQDSGFTRAKVLLLLPTRGYAKRWVDRLLQLLPAAQGRADAVARLDRYEREFGVAEEEAAEAARRARGKAEDFRAVFAGNRDDHFRLGLKVTRQSVRLYVDFFGADVLVASPLGLATKLEEGGAAADALSSIELVVVDGADVMEMQNWAHVSSVFAALNRMPCEPRPDTDIMRVRPWYLAGWARHYRQTVLLAAHPSAQVSALLARSCANADGCLRLRQTFAGVLHAIVPAATQTFARVSPARSPASVLDDRFEHFRARVWPRLRVGARGGDLLVTPSYFDFVRLRAFLRAEGAAFVTNSEYSDPSDVGRARAAFSAGRARLMLYSERAHFYRRHAIRGVRRIHFYGPPERAQFYSELLNLAETDDAAAPPEVTVLFSRWDVLALERIVGTSRAQKMLESDAPSFVFC